MKLFGPPTEDASVWCRVRKLVALQRQTVENTPIVEIQPKGSQPPLFLVHGVGGGMLWGYHNLARHLGEEQPVYAFKSRGLDGMEEFTRIEDMAESYIADLLKFQPQGPYYLGGYCFGGNVAYEMAQQLTAQGQAVALLLLMNCWANNSSYTRLNWTPVFVAKFFWNLALRLHYQILEGARQPRNYLQWRAGWIRKRNKAFLSRKMEDKVAVNDIADLSPQPEHERKLWRTHVQAWLQYQARPYAGRIVLLRTRGHPLVCSFDHAMGWDGIAAGGVTVKVCPGDHESILEEKNAAHAARQLKAVLAEVQNANGDRTEPVFKTKAERFQVAAKSTYAARACKIGAVNNSPAA